MSIVPRALSATRAGLLLLVLVAPVLVAAPAQAAESLLTSVFFRLPGTWQGEGTVGGFPAKTELTWAPVFDGRFLRVTWRSTLKATDGRDLPFEAEGTFLPVTDARGLYAGTWFDSQSRYLTLAGRAQGDSLVANWSGPNDERGRTTYRLVDQGTLVVRDEADRAGTWRTLGLSTFHRVPAAAH